MFNRWEYRLWKRRRRRRRIALALIAVLLLAAVLHGGNSHPPHRHGARAPSPSSAARPARRGHPDRQAVVRSSGPAKAHSEATPTAGVGLSWADFHGIELPYSAKDGPHHTRGGLTWGFTDTPRGALLAAVNIAVRTAALWGPATFEPTIRQQVTGPDAGALLSSDVSDYAAIRAEGQVRSQYPPGRGYAAEAAFRFLAFTPATATVEIVTEGPGSGSVSVMTATRIQLVWRRGDWRVIAPPGGDWASSATPVSSLTGYTIFAKEG